MNSIVRVFWNALLTAVAVTLLGGLFVAAMPPVYVATAIVKGDADTMLQLQSGALLQAVVKQTSADLADLEGWLEELVSSKADSAVLLKNKLHVSTGEQDGWINISVEAQDAMTASTLANDIARLYLQQNARVSLTADEKARLFAAVEAADFALLDFLDKNPAMLSAEAELALRESRVTRLEQDQLTLKRQLADIKRKLQQVASQETGSLHEPGVVRASQRLETAIMKRAELAARYGDRHAKMSVQDAEISAARHMLESVLLEYSQRLKADIAEHELGLLRLDADIEFARQQVDLIGDLLFAKTELELSRDAAIRRYEGMTEESVIDTFSEAIPPGNVLGFNQFMLLGFAFLFTFMLMVLLMVVRVTRSSN